MDSRWEKVRAIVLNMVERCAVCGQRFSAEDLQALGRSRSTWAFRLTCQFCGASSLIAAVIDEEQLAGSPVPEVHEPVTQRDVEEIREFLEHFDGDFQRLFGYRGGNARSWSD
ncbi:MAG: hypothetical protein RMJ05_06415 [Thermomicrobium sp.]|nr:hypothetical protein [Thermomicrobium sp.]MDW8006336.1 hypothetical protein [Thermomicrobium sp.]